MRHRFLRGTMLLAGISLFLFPLIQPSSLQAQTTAAGMPAGLLKRLAAAVDGRRTGAPVWVTVDTTFPYYVWGVLDNPDSAQSARLHHPRSVTFGPYYAPPDSGNQQTFLTKTCWKDQATQWHCPDTLAVTNPSNVLSVQITVRTRDGHEYTSYPGPDVEAVFFTLSGIDRLLLPYYTMLYGPHYAEQQRDSVLLHIRRPAPPPRTPQ